MRPDPQHEAGRWLAQAADDLNTAKRLQEIDIHYACCFFAQQAAEKALKAVLILQGAARVYGHSVTELCAAIAANDPDFAPLSTALAPLDLYYIPTRYPNGLAGGVASSVFTREDSDRALRLAQSALDSARNKVPEPPGPPAGTPQTQGN